MATRASRAGFRLAVAGLVLPPLAAVAVTAFARAQEAVVSPPPHADLGVWYGCCAALGIGLEFAAIVCGLAAGRRRARWVE